MMMNEIESRLKKTSLISWTNKLIAIETVKQMNWKNTQRDS